MSKTSKTYSRSLAAVYAGLAVALLSRPDATARVVAGPDSTPAPALVARVLGARLAGQGLLLALSPTSRSRRLSAAIDAAHGLSMIGVYRYAPGYRRTALVNAALAAVTAAASITHL